MIDVSVNHLLLHIESNNFRLSCIRFCNNINKKNSLIIIVTSLSLFTKIQNKTPLLTNFYCEKACTGVEFHLSHKSNFALYCYNKMSKHTIIHFTALKKPSIDIKYLHNGKFFIYTHVRCSISYLQCPV